MPTGSETAESQPQQQQQVEKSPKKGMAVRRNIQEFLEHESLEISLGRVAGVECIVTRTAQMLLKVICMKPYWTGAPNDLIHAVRASGSAIQRRNPLEFEIGNTVLRVLRFIRRAAALIAKAAEAEAAGTGAGTGAGADAGMSALLTSAIIATPSPVSTSPSAGDVPLTPQKDLSSSPLGLGCSSSTGSSAGAGADADLHTTSASRVLSLDFDEKPYLTQTFSKKMRGQLRDMLCTNVADFENEVELAVDEICGLAREHVHPNECILVYGYSTAVLRFLCAARRHGVRFEVLVAEAAPRGDGQEMAVELVQAGITATLVPDSALFAMMPRINKVVCGAHAIMANGGVLGAAGLHLVALAARRHAVPFIVCASLIKLTPRYPYDLDVLACLANPAEVLPHTMLPRPDLVDVLNPRFDYVPPECVSLLITDHGCHTPSFIYRLLEDYYDAEDYQYTSM